ncbi:adenosylcobinamide-GDP ribazoletransferase [Alkaliphilus serpentinus]|uniref:Adenosylcobinamide-GDP ribazoletransferase n=1 Tax=Alkaliphilus serpentinus TaxID=1482731 RepID=A0A833HR90_9FIRM|nr:adenosylcobinamide-GDP ribazoletransferase [Alkaliphilus serpentinus]KAB3532852.1 adenosylcobinamide-GDP ribazoletransferase [Alkaliphilus serpentinus]
MLKALILTLQFLTRFPINVSIEVNRKTLAKGTTFYPFVGMLIGAIAAVIYYGLSYISMDVAALGGVFAIIFVTGGLHLDGLADTADGFFSSRPREKILEIMKDSHVGAFGVVAIVSNILGKYILLKDMEALYGGLALILSCGIGRMASAMLFTFGKSARPGGLGDMVTNNHNKGYFIVGLMLFGITGFIMAEIAFIVSLLTVLLFSLLLMAYSYRVIGGLTGDVYGAACEMGEMMSLTIFLMFMLWR